MCFLQLEMKYDKIDNQTKMALPENGSKRKQEMLMLSTHEEKEKDACLQKGSQNNYCLGLSI